MKNTINKYFEVKVKMQKTQEDGTQKRCQNSMSLKPPPSARQSDVLQNA